MPELVNVAARLRRNAAKTPNKPAVVLCKGQGRTGHFRTSKMTFAELERDSDAAARGFEALGIGRGTKTLVMLRPSFPFFSCFFALFKVGAVPVLIDPGMGGRRLLECVRRVEPTAMVGIPLAHAARTILPGYFPKLKTRVTLGRRWFWGGERWETFRRFADEPYAMAGTTAADLAAILFTTGSTGPAKGVEYSHAALDRQVTLIAGLLGVGGDDVDAATFPGFSLFSVALGMTAVVPDLDPTRPGSAHPENIETAITSLGCTFSFGSPALWRRVSEHAVNNHVMLPSLMKVAMAGAPVPPVVHQRLLGGGILPQGGETFTPYGATECMPVASIGGREILAETVARTQDGHGVCVGYPVFGLRAEIIPVTDAPIERWDEHFPLAPNRIGEIVVKATHASRNYHGDPGADRLAKIADADGFWHRMGDVGYKDEAGRLWFCGRKAHRVETAAGTLYSVCCEAIFNNHPKVLRSALVGVPAADGFKRPVIAIEGTRPFSPDEEEALRLELFSRAAFYEVTAGIGNILFHPGFPVDIRHNAKIRREDLAVWAAARLK